jgi:GDP-mannose 4,6-dehydratase
MKVLITGITGFVGSHLADYLIDNQLVTEVHGIKRWRSPLDNISHKLNEITLHNCDLRDQSSLITVLRKVRPDIIFHLAAQSYVPTSLTAPADTYENNIVGTSNLLEAVRLLEQDPMIMVCSSSEVYGQVTAEDVPIKETCRFRPSSPYAISKAAKDNMAWWYHEAYGMRIVRSRAFTHTGPRRGSVFALSAFARQIALIEAGKQEPILKVGNLDSIRTWLDVRDIVKAYWLLTAAIPGEAYNIGGNYTCTVGEALDELISFFAKADQIQVQVDPSLLRRADVTLQIPDTSKFYEATGWKPEIPFSQTCKDILDYWRARV